MSNILLVEPDKLLADIYVSAVAGDGHKTTWVTDAQSAILACDAERPDVIVLEVQLVLHNGIELLYELRSYADLQKTPVIMQSFTTDVEFRISPIASVFKIAAYLNKTTTTLETYRATVERVLAVAV